MSEDSNQRQKRASNRRASDFGQSETPSPEFPSQGRMRSSTAHSRKSQQDTNRSSSRLSSAETLGEPSPGPSKPPVNAAAVMDLLSRLERDVESNSTATVEAADVALLKQAISTLGDTSTSQRAAASERARQSLQDKFRSLPELYDDGELRGFLLKEYVDQQVTNELETYHQLAAAIGGLTVAQRRGKSREGRRAVAAASPLPVSAASGTTSAETLEKMRSLMSNIDSWDFDIIALHDLQPAAGTLVFLGHSLLNAWGLPDAFTVAEAALNRFLVRVQGAYLDNPYHNSLHAADVLQTLHHVLTHSPFTDDLPDDVLFATLLSAIIHDIAHPGYNNQFLIAANHELAIRYNDRSPLENMHVSFGFELMMKEQLLASLSTPAKQRFRKTCVTIVMATDNAVHGKYLNRLQDRMKLGNFDSKREDDRLLLLRNVLHAADVSNPAKPPKIAKYWAKCIVAEFYRQGDKELELGLPVTPMLDRRKPIPTEKFQAGFINAIVLPLFSTLGEVPGINCSHALPQLHRNVAGFQRKIARRQSTILQSGQQAAMQAAAIHAAAADEAEQSRRGPLAKRISDGSISGISPGRRHSSQHGRIEEGDEAEEEEDDEDEDKEEPEATDSHPTGQGVGSIPTDTGAGADARTEGRGAPSSAPRA